MTQNLGPSEQEYESKPYFSKQKGTCLLFSHELWKVGFIRDLQVSILTSVHAYVFSIGSEILEQDCFLAKSNHCGELKYLTCHT